MINPVLQQMINAKLNAVTKPELFQLAQQYQFSITNEQANHIIRILKSETIDIMNNAQQKRILQRLEKEVDPIIAQNIAQLLQQLQHTL